MALSKKTKKILWIAAVVVIGLPLLAALVVFIKLNSFVKWGVEVGGSRTLGVAVQLQKADISLFRESITLTGLDVASPEGFSAPSFVKVGSMHLAASAWALTRNEVHVRDITIKDPEFTVEMVGGKTNIGAVMDHLKKEKPAPSAEEKPETKKKGAEMKMKIDHLLLSGVKVHMVGLGQDRTVELPSVEISDIADSNGNAVPVSKVVTIVLKHVSGEASVMEALGKAGKALEKEFKGLEAGGASVLEGVKGEAGKLTNIFK